MSTIQILHTAGLLTHRPAPLNVQHCAASIYSAADTSRPLAAVETNGDARRLVAAWNACDGIGTDLLAVSREHGFPPLELLRRAEQFISGFEDDGTQTGIVELLCDIRKFTGEHGSGPNTEELDAAVHAAAANPGAVSAAAKAIETEAGRHLVVCHVVIKAPTKAAAIEAASAVLEVGMSGASENNDDEAIEFEQAYAHAVECAEPEDFTPAPNERTPHAMPPELAREGYHLEVGPESLHVEGRESDDEDAPYMADGEVAPFVIFSPARQSNLPGHFATRAEAEAAISALPPAVEYWYTLCRNWAEAECGCEHATPEAAIEHARRHCATEKARGAAAFTG